ncbi:MAG: hypothetical protein JXR48_11135 [Candidatus Delongbacteria bacterium]|nr:hypothetical protein [Candidatus Delongbacteria bacterium]
MNIQQIIELGNQEIIDNGYLWFNENVLTCKKEITSQTDIDVVEEYFFLLGDVYELADAMNSAIDAYKMVLKVNENNVDALLELANLYENFGEYELAKEFFTKALKNGADGDVIESIKELDIQIKEHTPPLYSHNDNKILISEYLFKKEYENALSLVGNDDFLLKARIYGAMGNNEMVLSIWDQISKNANLINFDIADSFFIPNKLKEDVKFWKIIETNIAHFTYDSIFWQDDNLNSKYHDLPIIERRKLNIQKIIFQLEKNSEGLKRLKEEYPMWEISNID